MNRGFLSQIENGYGNPSLDTLHRIAFVLGITVGNLIDGPNLSNNTQNFAESTDINTVMDSTIPLLYSIPDGDWHEWKIDCQSEKRVKYIPRNLLKGKSIFAIKVNDDCMKDVLHSEDILVVDPEKPFVPRKNGRIGVVIHARTYKVRNIRLSPDGCSYILQSFNREYGPEILLTNEATIFKIIDWRPNIKNLF